MLCLYTCLIRQATPLITICTGSFLGFTCVPYRIGKTDLQVLTLQCTTTLYTFEGLGCGAATKCTTLPHSKYEYIQSRRFPSSPDERGTVAIQQSYDS